MPDIESLYKKADGKILIEIKLSSIMQLYNSFDPSPFHEKELDTDAEKYIIDTIKDFPAKTECKLVIHLPADLAQSEGAKTLVSAIHNHFEYKMMATERKFRQRLKYGRTALLIGLCFLFINLIIRHLLLQMSDLIVPQLIAEALLIIGWVAMWEPITVLLYELWPIIQTKKVYQKVSTMEIDIRPSTG
jgi:hypothetical protein